MKTNTDRIRARHAREARLGIVADMFIKGHPIRAIQREVEARLGHRYSTRTIHNDTKLLLQQWREDRVESVDAMVQLELERISRAEIELWSQWEKSKEDYDRVNNTRRGMPMGRNGGSGDGGVEIQTYDVAEQRTNVLGLGDPRYIAEIRQQQIERRKLLGLYAPEKKEIGGEVTFASLLMESGVGEDDDADDIASRVMV